MQIGYCESNIIYRGQLKNLVIGNYDDNIVGSGVEGVVCDKFSVFLEGGKLAIYKRGKFNILEIAKIQNKLIKLLSILKINLDM